MTVIASSLHGAGSAIYSGVGGGCMLTSLINFSDRQENAALKRMSRQKVKGMDFYKNMIHFWSWMQSLESRKDVDSKAASCLEISGVSSVVCGQEMPLKSNSPYMTAQTCQLRASVSQYGYHNPREFMDSCLKDL